MYRIGKEVIRTEKGNRAAFNATREMKERQGTVRAAYSLFFLAGNAGAIIASTLLHGFWFDMYLCGVGAYVVVVMVTTYEKA